MQLTLELEDSFVNSLQKEFHTSNIKEALYALYSSYQESQKGIYLEPISQDDSDHNYIIEGKKARDNGEKLYSIDEVLDELQ